MEKHKALYGLPEKVVFCKKCVISNQRPSSTIEFKHDKNEKKHVINFDDNQVCAACKYNEEKQKEIDWDKREKLLQKLCDKYRKNDGSYDVLVPGSGGKDSGFQSHILKYKYGMNPLTVTWAPHLYTDIGWKNFTNWIHVGGHDNILYTPNGKLHRLLTRLSFKNLLHPFQPFILGQKQIGASMAEKFGIKLVMYGENQAEYGNETDENKIPNLDPKYFSQSSSPMDLILGGVKVSEIIEKYDYKLNDFIPYFPYPYEKIKSSNINVQFLGYYLKWDPQEAYYYSSHHNGFSANTERTEGTYSKYSSIDDKIDNFHYLTTLIKFGIGRTTYDAAQEIRNGKITREEGQILVQKFDEEFPKKYFKEFLEYIDISEEEFHETLDKFRSPHLWGKDELDNWRLRHNVNGSGLDD
tara:strand:- start:435 stop:1667 length:1233 start_codon:yes stop_codon:yes gene_type:complete